MIPRADIARAYWLGAFYSGLGVIWEYKVSTWWNHCIIYYPFLRNDKFLGYIIVQMSLSRYHLLFLRSILGYHRSARRFIRFYSDKSSLCIKSCFTAHTSKRGGSSRVNDEYIVPSPLLFGTSG